jgi:hypothetical protein
MTEYPTEQEASKCETQLPGTRRATRIYNPDEILTVKSWTPCETFELVTVKVIRTEIGPASSGTRGLHENYVIVDKWIDILDYYDHARDCWETEHTTRIPASKIDD